MSETLPLSREQLRHLQEMFLGHETKTGEYRERHFKYLGLVDRVRLWSDDELRQPDAQRELWESCALGSIGPGQYVNTSAAYEDEQVIEALVSLRQRTWPEQAEARAQAMQRAYDEILALVHPRLSKRRPAAKLYRVFATLLPEDFHRCFSWLSRQHVSRLVLGRTGDGVQNPVLVRHRLRQVLGDEEALPQHVERSFFCWWLHEYYEDLRAGESIGTEATGLVVRDTARDNDLELPLVLSSFTRQRKGIGPVSGYVDTLRAIVRSCEGGANQDDVNMALREEHGLGHLQAPSVRGLMSTARALGLVEQRDGLWFSTDAGEETLDTDPPDILVERMIERIFGMAQLLRIIEDGETLPRAELFQKLRAQYSGWQTDFTPSALLAWASHLGLVEQDDRQVVCLTDYGSGWAKRLPEVLPGAPSEQEGSGERSGAIADEFVAGKGAFELLVESRATSSWEPPSFSDIWDAFREDGALRRFVFEERDILELHLAWHPPADGAQDRPRKRFVILSGLSGTGKTAILTHYARIYCRLAGIDRPDDHCTMVAVSPDWRDPSGLLGYVNALTPDPTYLREPTLVHLLAANANPRLPYFLILDEMNLAHPEHYFAPFLSAMETGGRLDLHAHDPSLLGIPSAIPWPRNLFIGGTVNMDETTHAFSDKVLDRAFTIEFWNVDLGRFFEARREHDVRDIAAIDAVYGFFVELNDALFKVRRHVGYRSVGEAIDFVRAAAREGQVRDETALWHFMDQAVHAKVLPRLRGHDSDDLRAALQATRKVCEQHSLSRCTSKLDHMLARLVETGVTRFFA